MEIVKSMLGGVIGGAVGALVANMIQSISGYSGPWFLLITGLGTGIGVRIAAGLNRSFVTGVVGAVTTVIVLLGSTVATSMAEVRANAKEVAITKIDAAVDPSIDDVSATSDVEAEDAEAEESAADSEAEPTEDSDTPSDASADEAVDGDDWDPADEQAAQQQPLQHRKPVHRRCPVVRKPAILPPIN